MAPLELSVWQHREKMSSTPTNEIRSVGEENVLALFKPPSTIWFVHLLKSMEHQLIRLEANTLLRQRVCRHAPTAVSAASRHGQ